MRVAWVATHPIQYQVPVFRELAKRPEIEFRALFLSDHGTKPSLDPGFGAVVKFDVPLLDGYDWKIVQTSPPRFGEVGGIGAGTLDQELRAGRFDSVVVSGYAYRGLLDAVRLARRYGARVVLLSETTLEQKRRSLPAVLAKKLFFRWLLRKDDRGLAPGSRARRYLEWAGISAERIHDFPYCPDTALTDAARPERERLRTEARQELGIDKNRIVASYCGKLIPVKNPDGALDAFLESRVDAELLIIGTGPLEAKMKQTAAGNPRVHFLGFRNQTALPRLYAATDLLLLGSHAETWGLVVNEAMAMGAAAIVSDHVGCSPDLVSEKETGLVFPAEDPASFAAAIREATSNRERLAAWGRNAAALVRPRTPALSANGVVEAALAG